MALANVKGLLELLPGPVNEVATPLAAAHHHGAQRVAELLDAGPVLLRVFFDFSLIRLAPLTGATVYQHSQSG